MPAAVQMSSSSQLCVQDCQLLVQDSPGEVMQVIIIAISISKYCSEAFINIVLTFVNCLAWKKL